MKQTNTKNPKTKEQLKESLLDLFQQFVQALQDTTPVYGTSGSEMTKGEMLQAALLGGTIGLSPAIWWLKSHLTKIDARKKAVNWLKKISGLKKGETVSGELETLVKESKKIQAYKSLLEQYTGKKVILK